MVKLEAWDLVVRMTLKKLKILKVKLVRVTTWVVGTGVRSGVKVKVIRVLKNKGVPTSSCKGRWLMYLWFCCYLLLNPTVFFFIKD